MKRLLSAFFASLLALLPAQAQVSIYGPPQFQGTVLEANPSNPAGTSSTTIVMMGVGSTCVFTPKYSTRAFVHIDGSAAGSTLSSIIGIQVRYASGGAPANGAAFAGSAIGTTTSVTTTLANAQEFFFSGGAVTGLSPGTAYWFDVGLNVSAGTASVTNLSCGAFEF
jgi:hypothetical protein